MAKTTLSYLPTIIMAASLVSFGFGGAPVERALAWGAGGGGGPNDYDKEQYKPKKLSPEDRAKLNNLLSQDAKLRKEKAGMLSQPVQDFERQVEATLKELQNKSYDTDPEYERDVFRLKKAIGSPGQIGRPGDPNDPYSPGIAVGPGGAPGSPK